VYTAYSTSSDASAVFKVIVTPPSDLQAGSYQFVLLDPRDSFVDDFTLNLSSLANNNSPDPTVQVAPSSFNNLFGLEISGWGPISNKFPTGQMPIKVSNTDLGVNGNTVSKGQLVRFDITDDANPTGFETFAVQIAPTGDATYSNSSNPTQYTFEVFFKDGSSVSLPALTCPPPVAPSSNGLLVADLSLYDNIDYIELSSNANNFKIGGVSFSYEVKILPDDYHLEVVDADGDLQLSDTFAVLIDGNGNGLYERAPITIDLNRDGEIAYLSVTESQSAFDYNGDGVQERTAWVGADDGLLVYDYNHDQSVNDGSEISFAGYHPDALTDLQGLALAFDTNQDGCFDAADAAFADFGVWQDANGNGLTDEGEFRSLQDLGIVQIDLAGDGVSSTAAGGDVVIHGSTTVTYSDGSTALAQDVQFATLPLEGLLDQSQSDTALPVVVDSNDDGILSIDDSIFAAVGVWADQNGDGLVTADEVTSLHDSGIASIELGAGLVSTIADGYLHLDGSAAVTHHDGSQILGSDVHLAVLIDQVVADPAVLDSLDASTPDSFIAPQEVTSVTDLGQVVDVFLASEPVTDADLVTLSQDIQLSSDVSAHDTSSTTDPAHLDATSSDAAVYDPSHDMAAYDPAQDTTLHDPMHDVIIHDVVV
jgi:hypothetical protein